MVKYKVILAIFLFAFLSCNSENNSNHPNSVKDRGLTWEIGNRQLIEQIELYYKLVGDENNDKNVLSVYCKNDGNVSTYYMNFFFRFLLILSHTDSNDC